MATGEIKWSSKGKSVERRSFEPLPAGDYDLKLNASECGIKKGQEPGKVPYISVPFEALGTNKTETGKNQKVFHNVFLHLSASEKDGKNMLERQGGLLDMAASLGEDIEVSGMEVPYQKYDGKGVKVGGLTRIAIAKPQEVLEWLKSHDGAVFRAKVKVDKGSGDYGPSNRIDYFIPSEDAGKTEDEYTLDEEEVEELDAGDEETDEEEVDDETEEVDEDEETPAPAPVKKLAPSSKVKQGPAGKGKRK